MPEKYHVRARKVDMKKAKLAQKKEMCWLQVGGGSEQTFGNLQLRCPSRRAGSSPVFLVSQQTRWKERKRRDNHRKRKTQVMDERKMLHLAKSSTVSVRFPPEISNGNLSVLYVVS